LSSSNQASLSPVNPVSCELTTISLSANIGAYNFLLFLFLFPLFFDSFFYSSTWAAGSSLTMSSLLLVSPGAYSSSLIC